MLKRCQISLAVTALVVLGFTAFQPAAPQGEGASELPRYTITDLDQGQARGINDLGQVWVGGNVFWENGERVSVDPAIVLAMSDKGEIVYQAEGRFSLLPQLRSTQPIELNVDTSSIYPGATRSVGIYALNNNRQMLIFVRIWGEGILLFEGTYFWENGGLTQITIPDPESPGAFIGGWGNDLSNLGYVAGYVTTSLSSPTWRALLWSKGGGTPLPTLGGSASSGARINDVGDVIGSSFLPGDQTQHACLWRGGMTIDLGSLSVNSTAYDINNRGEVVGKSDYSDRTHAFLWTQGTKMVDLNDLIPPDSGWELREANHINNKGQIVGTGFLRGIHIPHVFLLTPDRGADLSVTKIADPEPVRVGDYLTHTITVTNNGISDATNVRLEDTLPPGVTLEDDLVIAPGSWFKVNDNPIFDLGRLAPGDSADVEIVVTVTDAVSGNSLTNTASATAEQTDPDPSDNTATVTTTVCAEDVTDLVDFKETLGKLRHKRRRGVWTLKTNLVIRNTSSRPLKGPLSFVLDNLSGHVLLTNKSGVTVCTPQGSPYITIGVGSDNVFSPGERVRVTLEYTLLRREGISANRRTLAGPGAR